MIKKMPMMVLMIIFVYSLIPILFILNFLGLSSDQFIEKFADIYRIIIISIYILSFIDIYFLCKNRNYYRMMRLALLGKIFF